jgi:hypothetical protein
MNMLDDNIISSENADFCLVDKFWIDNGELEGLSPQEIFVLGFEFYNILNRILWGLPFKIQFHNENVERVKKALLKYSVPYELFDANSSWPMLDAWRKAKEEK